MTPTNPEKVVSATSVHLVERELRSLIGGRAQWFISEDGEAPVEVNCAEFDFSQAHGRLLFSSWTERGARTWRVNSWNWRGEKLSLYASRRMGAETVTIELVPRASAKALVQDLPWPAFSSTRQPFTWNADGLWNRVGSLQAIS